MSIIGLLVLIALLGLLAYLLVTFVPMPQQFKTLIIVVAILIALLVVLQAFGVIPSLTRARVPSVG